VKQSSLLLSLIGLSRALPVWPNSPSLQFFCVTILRRIGRVAIFISMIERQSAGDGRASDRSLPLLVLPIWGLALAEVSGLDSTEREIFVEVRPMQPEGGNLNI
jgi:hypothetical protein